MALSFNITEQEAKQASIPHEIFLTNLILNHILVFVTILSASSIAQYVVVVPAASILSMLYLIWGAYRAKRNATWYVNGHWQLCAKRNLLFMGMVMLVSLVFAAMWLMTGGHMRPQHWAVGGAVFLPAMVTVLILIILESEALHHARIGILPNWVLERFPVDAPKPIEDLATEA